MSYFGTSQRRLLLSISSLVVAATTTTRPFTTAFVPQVLATTTRFPSCLVNHKTQQHRRPFHHYHSSTMSAAATFSTSPDSKTDKAVLSPRVLETLDPCVVLMKDLVGKYAHLWQDKGGIYSLAQGVVYWEPPSSCQQALLGALQSSSNVLHTYGPAQGIPELTEAIQQKLSVENNLTNHQVMVTMGANQAYFNIVMTCLCDSSKAIVFSPYYFNHVMALQMTCGNDSVVVGPCNDQGIPDLAWLEQQLSSQNIDMVTIVNPGNPTGVSLEKDLLQTVVDLTAKYNAWLVLDCTYEYFTPSHHQPIATFPQQQHVMHIFSFSKSYSMAGYRCGYLVLHENQKELWNQMSKVQDTLPICPSRISQMAALGALQAGKQWVYDKYATLDPSRELILNAISSLDQIMGGTGAMYVMGKLPQDNNNGGGGVVEDVEFCRQLVQDHGVAIIPGTYCGFPGWIRVCYGNLEAAQCQEAAKRLKLGIEAILSSSASSLPKTKQSTNNTVE